MQEETFTEMFCWGNEFGFSSLFQKGEHAAFCVLPVQEPTVDYCIEKNPENA